MAGNPRFFKRFSPFSCNLTPNFRLYIRERAEMTPQKRGIKDGQNKERKLSMPDTDSFHIDGVPDFDQRRHGLPENGGAYCIPTSTMDLLF